MALDKLRASLPTSDECSALVRCAATIGEVAERCDSEALRVTAHILYQWVIAMAPIARGATVATPRGAN